MHLCVPRVSRICARTVTCVPHRLRSLQYEQLVVRGFHPYTTPIHRYVAQYWMQVSDLRCSLLCGRERDWFTSRCNGACRKSEAGTMGGAKATAEAHRRIAKQAAGETG